MSNLSDDEIRKLLKELDEEDIDVTRFEADFIESVCFKRKGSLSEKQRDVARNILDKYGYL